MAKRCLNNWRRWLPLCTLSLLAVSAFAPLSGTPHRIVSLLALVGMVVFPLADSRESRKEFVRFLIPLAAVVLLALLVSIDPKWVIFGFVGVYIGICLRDLFKLEHAEYLTERKCLQ